MAFASAAALLGAATVLMRRGGGRLVLGGAAALLAALLSTGMTVATRCAQRCRSSRRAAGPVPVGPAACLTLGKSPRDGSERGRADAGARVSGARLLSRFTTWAYEFALNEAAVTLRRRACQGREVPLEPESDGRAGRAARGALYKTLHDARRKLRARLAAAGLAPEEERP
jgi:hypothetical protein